MGQYAIDQYSFLHFCAGFLANLLGINFWVWFLLHAGFEIIENTQWGIQTINKYFKGVWPGGKDEPDSLLNSMSDQFFASLGWLVASLI